MRNKVLSVMISAGMMAYGASAFAISGDSSSTAAAPTIAASTVTIYGHVNDSPCDITGGGNVDINYNEVSNKHITETPSHEHPFTIHLENCTFADAVSTPKVSIAFTSKNSLDTTGKIMQAGSTGVGVQISDNNTDASASGVNFVDFKTPTAHEINFPAGGKEMDLNFSTWLVKAGTGEITPGDFQATATYTLTYS